MAIVDPYAAPNPGQFTEDMWKEYASSFRPSGENIFNKRSGEAALVGFVPDVCSTAAMRFFLGYEQTERVIGTPPSMGSPLTDTFCLRRKNPIRHPKYKKLWCTGVAELAFKPDSATAATLKVASAAVSTGSPPALGYRTGYKKAKLVVRFGPSMVTFLEDTSPALPDLSNSRQEYLRNVSVDTIPRTETFEFKQLYVFQEGLALPFPYSEVAGSTVFAEQGQILVKPDIVVGWKDVPSDWIMTSATTMPTKILAALGKVNGQEIFGYPVGTLLLVGVKLDRHPWTLQETITAAPANVESDYLFDVEFLFSFFDPVKGFTGPAPTVVQITTNRGHNNFPYRGTGIAGAGDPQVGKWFYATVQGSAGQPIYNYTTFQEIFDCPQNYV